MANKYEIKRELLLKNLNKDEIEGYIDNLIRTIYENFISNDADKSKLKIRELHQVIDSLKEKYPYINEYVNYRCIVISNKVFESLFDRDVNLYYPKLKLDIDFNPNDELDLSYFIEDEKTSMRILIECFDDDLIRFMNFIKDLPQLKYYFKDEITIESYVPRSMIAKVTDFMNDVKDGVYDGYLEIPEDYIIDDDDYLNSFEYCKKRHKEGNNNASGKVFKY